MFYVNSSFGERLALAQAVKAGGSTELSCEGTGGARAQAEKQPRKTLWDGNPCRAAHPVGATLFL